jgi:preprotein translocase subunit SecD
MVSAWFTAICVLFPFGPVAADQSDDQHGGIYFLVDVQLQDAHAVFLDKLWPEVRDALAAERETVGFVMREDSPSTELRVRITRRQGATRAVDLVKESAASFEQSSGLRISNIDVQIDKLLLTVTLSEVGAAAIDKFTMVQTVEVLRNRFGEIDPLEVAILPRTPDRIMLVAFGIETTNGVFQLLTSRAQLSFHSVVSRTADAQIDVASGQMLLPTTDDASTFYILERHPVVTGDDLADVQADFDFNGNPAVSFTFSPSAARIFGEYTSENIGSPFAIVLNNEVISSPTIQSLILGGRGIITGNFTKDEVTNLVKTLQAGALPARLNVLEERAIGPVVNRANDEQ